MDGMLYDAMNMEDIGVELQKVQCCPLKIEVREGRGRCLVAGESIKRGQTILREDPYASVIENDQSSSIEEEALQACSPRKPSQTMLLAARIYYRNKIEGSGRRIEHLHSHFASVRQDRKVEFGQIAALIQSFLIAKRKVIEDWIPSVKAIAETLTLISTNAHSICDEDLNGIGIGLYPIAALANHSCTPNCIQVFLGRRIIFISNGIAKGEEICISYVDLCSLQFERRNTLLQHYFFDINPGSGGTVNLRHDFGAFSAKEFRTYPLEMWRENERDFVSINLRHSCPSGSGKKKIFATSNELAQISQRADHTEDKAEENVLFLYTEEDMDKATIGEIGDFIFGIGKMLGRGRALAAQNDMRSACTTLQKALSMCRKSAADVKMSLGEFHVLRVRILILNMHAAIQCQNFELALSLADELAGPYKAYYTKCSPVYGLHLAAKAKLELYFENFDDAAETARDALVILDKTLPRKSSVFTQVQETLDIALYEMR